MEKHLLPKPCPSGKKLTHLIQRIDPQSQWVVGWWKKNIPKTSRTIKWRTNQRQVPFSIPPKKRNTGAPVFLAFGFVFLGGKSPNLRNINFQPKKTSLLGLNIRLSCLVVNLNFRLFIPSNSQGFEMGAKCSSGYELGEILLRCVVPVFSPKTQAIPCGGEGVGQKNFDQSALFSRNLVEKTNWNFQKNMNSQWIDHSIVFED